MMTWPVLMRWVHQRQFTAAMRERFANALSADAAVDTANHGTVKAEFFVEADDLQGAVDLAMRRGVTAYAATVGSPGLVIELHVFTEDLVHIKEYDE